MDINTSIHTLIEPIMTKTESLTGLLKIIFGSLIGLYLIAALLRFYEVRSLKKLINEMRKEIRRLDKTVRKLDKHILRQKK